MSRIAIGLSDTPVRAEYLRDLLLVLTQKEVQIRYRNTWLGYAWSLLHPLTFALVYYLAFGVIMKVPIDNYPVFLVMGLFPWQWVSHSLATAPNIFLANATLIKKVKFPWNMLVVSAVANFGVQFVLSVPVMVGVAIWHGCTASLAWVAGVPLLAAVQFTILYGMSLAIASANLFFRDLERLVSLGITFLFFLTPITYSVHMIPSEFRWLLYANPMASIMLSWQELLLTPDFPWVHLGWALLVGLGSMLVGTAMYHRMSHRFAEVI